MKTFEDYGIRLNRQHGQTKTTCPQCSSMRKKPKDPCLSVNIDEGAWNCHNCGWAGGLGHKQDGFAQFKTKVVISMPSTDLPDKVVEWFAGRGITKEVIIANKIGYEKTWMPAADGEVMAITFPYFKRGEVVNIKYRDGKKNFKQVKDGEKVFYGMDGFTGTEAIIVEGEMDKLSLDTVGFKTALSVPDGAPAPSTKNYETKFSYLDSCADLIEPLTKIIIAVDNDEAGKTLEAELVRRVGPER